MRHVFAFAVLSLSIAGCLAPSESPEPDDMSTPLESARADTADSPEPAASVSGQLCERTGEAADEDAVGGIFGTIGGGIAGSVLGGLVFGPVGFWLGGLAGGAVGGTYGALALGNRPPFPGGPPPYHAPTGPDPWFRPGGDRP